LKNLKRSIVSTMAIEGNELPIPLEVVGEEISYGALVGGDTPMGALEG
jgi:hypothetical protein